MEFFQAGVSIGTLTRTEDVPNTLEFGTLALGASSEAFGIDNDPGDADNGIDLTNVQIHATIAAAAVPEPGTLSVLLGGMTLAMLRRRR